MIREGILIVESGLTLPYQLEVRIPRRNNTVNAFSSIDALPSAEGLYTTDVYLADRDWYMTTDLPGHEVPVDYMLRSILEAIRSYEQHRAKCPAYGFIVNKDYTKLIVHGFKIRMPY
jgi:hypothetical protein